MKTSSLSVQSFLYRTSLQPSTLKSPLKSSMGQLASALRTLFCSLTLESGMMSQEPDNGTPGARDQVHSQPRGRNIPVHVLS